MAYVCSYFSLFPVCVLALDVFLGVVAFVARLEGVFLGVTFLALARRAETSCVLVISEQKGCLATFSIVIIPNVYTI